MTDDDRSADPDTPDPTTDRSGRRALVAARDAETEPDTAEIRELAAAAGYVVVGAVTQRRREDPTYGLGRGRAEDLMRLAAETDAEAVIYDGSLSPGQTFSLGELLPAGVAVIDRPRLVLDRLATAADSRSADIQFELARLRYELPRLREVAARDRETVRLRPEGRGRVRDLERRIDALEERLETVTGDRSQRRAERRAAGFDLVVAAGYTNAGTSRLCRRLAASGDSGGADNDGGGADNDGGGASGDTLDPDAADSIADRPFGTVATSTTEATLGGRRALITDTVGFVGGVAHEAMASFRATLEAIRDADCVLLVIDAGDDLDTLREKLRVVLSAVGSTAGPVVPALNKADRVDASHLDACADAVRATAAALRDEGVAVADALGSPIPTSARDGAGCDDLAAAVAESLPTATTTLTVPYGDGVEAALSWAYDREVVADVAYRPDDVRVELGGRPSTVEAAARRFDQS
jgi:GTP-binding protein HflX